MVLILTERGMLMPRHPAFRMTFRHIFLPSLLLIGRRKRMAGNSTLDTFSIFVPDKDCIIPSVARARVSRFTTEM